MPPPPAQRSWLVLHAGSNASSCGTGSAVRRRAGSAPVAPSTAVAANRQAQIACWWVRLTLLAALNAAHGAVAAPCTALGAAPARCAPRQSVRRGVAGVTAAPVAPGTAAARVLAVSRPSHRPSHRPGRRPGHLLRHSRPLGRRTQSWCCGRRRRGQNPPLRSTHGRRPSPGPSPLLCAAWRGSPSPRLRPPATAAVLRRRRATLPRAGSTAQSNNPANCTSAPATSR